MTTLIFMLLLNVSLNVTDKIANCADVLDLLVGDLDLELVLNRHEQIYNVQRIRAKIRLQIGIVLLSVFFYIELLCEDDLNLF